MGFKFNPFTSTFDIVGAGGSGGIAIGDPISGIVTDNPILFADNSDLLAASQNLMFDPVAKTFTVGGDTVDIISQFSGAVVITDDANLLIYAGVDQGHVTINPSNDSDVIFEVFANSTGHMMYVDPSSHVNFGTNTDLGGFIGISSIATGDDTVRIRAISSQTGKLTSWQAVGTNQLIGVNVSGEMEYGTATQGVKVSGFSAGYLSLQGYGNSNNECIQLDLESIANTANWVTTTGVTTWKMPFTLDLSGISAGTPNMVITATSDTPTVTWGAAAGNEASAAPAGYLEIRVGANTRYIPFWA